MPSLVSLATRNEYTSHASTHVKPASPEPKKLLKDEKDHFELVKSAFPEAHPSSQVKYPSGNVQDLFKTQQWRNTNLGLKPGQSTALYEIMSFLNLKKAAEYLQMLANRPNVPSTISNALKSSGSLGQRITVGPTNVDRTLPVTSTSTHQITSGPKGSVYVIHEIKLTHLEDK